MNISENTFSNESLEREETPDSRNIRWWKEIAETYAKEQNRLAVWKTMANFVEK